MSRKNKRIEEMEQGLSKTGQLFKLAWKNIVAYGWMNAKICFTFACLAFLVCLFTVYNAALNQHRTELINGSISANYVKSATPCEERLVSDGCKIEFSDKIYHYDFSEATQRLLGVSKDLPPTSFTYLSVDGVRYNPYENMTVVCFQEGDEDYLQKYDYIELKQNYKRDSFLSAGTMPKEKNDAVVSAALLEAYGLNADEMIGKEVSLYLKDGKNPDGEGYLQFAAHITGLFDEPLYTLSGHGSTDNAPRFLFHRASDSFQGKTNVQYRYYLTDWPDEETVSAWTKEVFTMKYVGASLVNWVKSLNNVQILAYNLYVIIGLALAIGLILTIFLMIDKYMKVFSRTGGILLTLGMRRSRLYALLLIQLLIICIIAVPISLCFTLIGYNIINYFIVWSTHVELGLSFLRIISMLAVGIAAVVVFLLFFFLYAAMKLRRHTIKQFLTTDAT